MKISEQQLEQEYLDSLKIIVQEKKVWLANVLPAYITDKSKKEINQLIIASISFKAIELWRIWRDRTEKQILN